ncbi:MAG: LysR family transcriptional regulator [Desulfovibrionaceae bacterium]
MHRGMELYQLKTFVVVAEEGHLTRASERLHLSQPAVSGHIKALEEELGVALFARGARGMRLTEAGRALQGRAEAVLLAADELTLQARVLRREVSGRVRLGLNTDMTFLRVPRLVTAMRAAHPRVELELFHSLSGRIIEDLAGGRLDAGFAFGEHESPAVAFRLLTRVRVHIVAPAAWADQVRGADWADLARLPWIWTPPHCPFHQVAAKAFHARGLIPEKTLLADSDTVLRGLVASGAGLSHLIEYEARAAEAAGEAVIWDGEPLLLPAWLAWPARRGDEPLLRALRDQVAAVWGLAPETPDDDPNVTPAATPAAAPARA